MYREKHPWIYDLLFLLVFALAGYLRLTGVNWGEGQHQHPDENFLASVLASLQAQECSNEDLPVGACPPAQRRWLSIGDYFNSQTSTLNPYNRGYAFFVYGNLPMTLVRVAADALQEYDVKMLGRQFSALADLFTIFFLYLLVSRLYDRRVALLASLFSALTVMQIQQSHFFTTDLFVNAFGFLAIYFAIRILDTPYSERTPQRVEPAEIEPTDSFEDELQETDGESQPPKGSSLISSLQVLITNQLFLLSIGFGAAFGMAMASKVNIYPLAILLPAAFLVRHLIQNRDTDLWSVSSDYLTLVITCLVAGGLAAILAFRIFQPYAFDGLAVSSQWITNIQEQRIQARGDADLPWNLQWARRSYLYSFENLTKWGLGLPLGILAWAGFLMMGWRVIKGEWRHALLWGWTALYFFWQSLQFNPTMRYQLPIYPLLAMMAAWFIFEVAGWKMGRFKESRAPALLAGLVGITVVALTAVWAFAFHSIYLRDEPRMAASRWIFQNIPGPINLHIETNEDGRYNQPLAFPTGVSIRPALPYQTAFIAQNDGVLTEIRLAHVAASSPDTSSLLYLTVWEDLNDPLPMASSFTMPFGESSSSSVAQVANFDQPPVLAADQTYYLSFELAAPEGTVNLCGDLRLFIDGVEDVHEQIGIISAPCALSVDQPYLIPFIAEADGVLDEIVLEHAVEPAETDSEPLTLSAYITREPGATPRLAITTASMTNTFSRSTDPRGDSYTLALDPPIEVRKGDRYYLHLAVDSGRLLLRGAAVANETDYDYPLPFRVDNYDAFGGLYRGDLTLQVYFPDDEDKLDRFVDTLSQTDYIFIPTNHQYAQITRLPERYPLTAHYYRELMGCPEGMETIPCYHEAQPGDYEGRLGFDLVAVFENFPQLGPIEINDQYAEEAFTFYDHPKVFIFKKGSDFDSSEVRNSLSLVDVSRAANLTPRQFDDYSSLMLAEDTLAEQRAGGTWSRLFDYDWLQNKYPFLGLLLWYVFISLLGLAVYPLIRLALPGLADRGYPLSRAFGLVLLGYLSWIGGSTGIPYTRTTIGVVLGLIVLFGMGLAWFQREDLRQEWRARRSYFLMIEGLFLAFFLLELVIRLGNPDLWHPAKGGERPMDFSYFNAVIKSTSFPPYDPWFAGGYINYYYYGFVLVGTPVKLLGIVPSIAYNFILPTLFAIVGICAFSIGWNLLSTRKGWYEEKLVDEDETLPLLAGLSASAFTLLLGNLGTIQLIFQTLQRMGAGGMFEWSSSIFQRWAWAIQGLVMLFRGAPLAIGYGDWYWYPSRVLPPLGGNEITEFPLFTFIYSDLHAHMIAMPLALLALSWALAIVAGRARWQSPFAVGLGFAVGGLVIGALYPTNLSDIYTYLPVGLTALGYAIWRYVNTTSLARRAGWIAAAVLALTLLSFQMYQPYRESYSQVYSALNPWKGPYTPLGSYLTHWTVLLFVVVSWMAWETREWMAQTPVSALAKLKPYQLLIEGFLVAIVLLLLALQFLGTSVGWVALPIAAWAGVLLLRPNLPDAKRFVLFLIGTALIITIVVEIVVVRGDIGRQNTIFKFYLQSWFLLAASAGAALAWTLPAYFKWLPSWRLFWQSAMIVLISGAALFTVSGTAGKIRDRWILEAPRTLDAMTFMKYAHYDDFRQRLDLSEDYNGIRWMQDNVQGSPVIVEANCPEYRWCSRYTIYTGLPGVVGWNWHQRQQRGFLSTWVEDRVAEVGGFYNSVDPEYSRTFLEKYDVRYIVVGPLERAAYATEGIAKFETFEGIYWSAVYRQGDTVIYETILQNGE